MTVTRSFRALFLIGLLNVTPLVSAQSLAKTPKLTNEKLIKFSVNFGMYLSRADDRDAVRYVETIAKIALELGKTDPDKCFQFLFPSKYGLLRPEFYPPQFKNEFMQNTRMVIASGSRNATSVPTEEEAGSDFDAVFATLKKRHGKDALVITDMLSPKTPRQKACLMHANMYLEINKLPLKSAGRVIRWLNAP